MYLLRPRTRLTGLALAALLLVAPACGSKKDDQGAATSAASVSPAGSPAASGGAAVSPAAGAVKSWTTPPAMAIDQKKTYSAEVKTSKGSFTIQLYAKDAPKAVNNFVFLSKQRFYDGIVFHRIVETFMIQTGDPKGNGTGGPGYKFEHEPTKYKYDKYTVAYANSGPNTNGSQFFIVTGDASHLNAQPNYTVFGKVTAGTDTVDKIAKTPVKVGPSGERSLPTEKVTIDSITISEK